MSHYHAEIVMPPNEGVESTIARALAPFDENSEDASRKAFWDWYVIGGRWNLAHQTARIGKQRLEAFFQRLRDEKITVSGLQMGKQELQPAEQVPKVNAIWAEMFPEEKGPCPHFRNTEAKPCLAQNVCLVREIPDELMCETLIVCRADLKVEWSIVREMYHRSIWNGATHQDTTFDGNVKKALSSIEDVKPDWLCVTVDYHS